MDSTNMGELDALQFT